MYARRAVAAEICCGKCHIALGHKKNDDAFACIDLESVKRVNLNLAVSLNGALFALPSGDLLVHPFLTPNNSGNVQRILCHVIKARKLRVRISGAPGYLELDCRFDPQSKRPVVDAVGAGDVRAAAVLSEDYNLAAFDRVISLREMLDVLGAMCVETDRASTLRLLIPDEVRAFMQNSTFKRKAHANGGSGTVGSRVWSGLRLW